uniref:Non-reducing end beta-L-arabinofuranosidase n=1 Tax=Pseudothermotoga hypogea TaxID=57487 RepID=A0A832I7J8_9THEM
MALSSKNVSKFKEIGLGYVKPTGWLKKQLELQAEGLTGHLDEIWPDVGPNSAWLGGNGEDWERGPYYCDGLVPLAYILSEKGLISKAEKWMNSVLSSQTVEGFFGPKSNVDWWPRMVMLKALTSYYEATKDSRVLSFMIRYFEYQLRELKYRPLEHWAWARGFENLIPIFWLYERTNKPFLLELAKEILKQTIDWSSLFQNFPYVEPTERYLPKEFMKALGTYNGWKELLRDPAKVGLTKEEIEKLFFIYHTTHVVNVAMAFKEPALRYALSHDERFHSVALKGLESLTKHHGQPNGMFSGDEHLNGRRTTQGTELCAVVEFMYSLENLFKVFGDPLFADRLEVVAYNALPATIRPGFYAHQYDQQVNQVLCNVQKRNWYNNKEDSNIFGLEPNFGCCTANMHQGWPKFAKSLWMKSSEDCFVKMAYAPCVLEYKWNDSESVQIVEETNYPFDDVVEFFVTTDREIRLMLRIPSWSRSTTVVFNDERREYDNTQFAVLHLPKGKSKVKLEFHFEIQTIPWSDHTAFVQRGPLVFSLKIEEEWRKIKGNEPFADYEVYPKSDWNYALILPNEFNLERNVAKHSTPFEGKEPLMKIKVKAFRVEGWTLLNGSAAEPPRVDKNTLKNAKIEEIDLVPYGCTALRITEFPILFSNGGSKDE